ncbi:hypothetical protein TNCV_2264051 [Trichonephila clavipes]|nr:hypothetical protein TNCV_2264051 [Trichonephila clavipes]
MWPWLPSGNGYELIVGIVSVEPRVRVLGPLKNRRVEGLLYTKLRPKVLTLTRWKSASFEVGVPVWVASIQNYEVHHL